MYIVVERTILQHVSWIDRDRLDNVNEGASWKIDFYKVAICILYQSRFPQTLALRECGRARVVRLLFQRCDFKSRLAEISVSFLIC